MKAGLVMCRVGLLAVSLFLADRASAAADWVDTDGAAEGFELVDRTGAAAIAFDADDFEVVSIACHDLAADVARVTGEHPMITSSLDPPADRIVIAGTIGHSRWVDRLIDAGSIDVSAVKGKWETFLITTVAAPFPGAESALVIAGSDRRGTAYGVYELSQAIGVSPWYWWADVAPPHFDLLTIREGTRVLGPPSVKYRGIFINDEDWGLQPWAAKTFDPEEGDIGPKVYRHVFELLLRLKANTLWPAMHKCTRPFNSFPENAALADRYAIVMGSSHAEPMLRNNVGEWTAPAHDYNYISNREGVLRYWEDRLASNGRYENLYTLGMRGIHDSHMIGPKSDEERVDALEHIFADQRRLIERHVDSDVAAVPQIFCAYKEVLDLYREGLRVPDDVTIVWPDDNFGYVRNFASASERERSGGFGVYYHISYLGSPMAYLWLCTTPPALIWEEMRKAYAFGADRVWIANVGDIKPAEMETEFFLQMAWDIDRWRGDNLHDFLVTWARREFGEPFASEIADIMERYFLLNFRRKPEHLQWWLPNEEPRASSLRERERDDRLAAFRSVAREVEVLAGRMPEGKRDAFFELVRYPVCGSAFANERYLLGEASQQARDQEKAAELTAQAIHASNRLVALTERYNSSVAGGKWNRIIAVEPADDQWKSMRIVPWTPPSNSGKSLPEMESRAARDFDPLPQSGRFSFEEQDGVVSMVAGHFTRSTHGGGGGSWKVVPGLGRTGAAIVLEPCDRPGPNPGASMSEAPVALFDIRFEHEGTFPIEFQVLPTHPVTGGQLRIGVGVDDEAPEVFAVDVQDGGAAWAQGVLSGCRTVRGVIHVPAAGAHTLRVFGTDPGVVLDKIVIDCGGLAPCFLGPAETAVAPK